MTLSTTRPIAATLIGVASLAAAASAQAHAHLVASTPADGAVSASPKVITLRFTESLVPAFSGFDLISAQGAAAPLVRAKASDPKVLSATLAARLGPGAYLVRWRAASTDGHRMTGAYRFTVR